MIKIHALSSTARIHASASAPALSEELEEQVERLWQAEQRERHGKLFNGVVISATSIQSDSITAAVLDYRRFMAQRREPRLFAQLHVRPLAVSGLLRCPDGIVFGLRALSTTSDRGLWELVPSGGLDETALDSSRIDLRAQVLTELREEIGIQASQIDSIEPFCLIEDLDSHVLDVGMALMTSISFERISQAHQAHGSDEYEQLMVVPDEAIQEFEERMGSQLVTVSSALIREYREREATGAFKRPPKRDPG